MSVPLAFERPVGELPAVGAGWTPAPHRSVAVAIAFAAAATVAVVVLVDVVLLLTVGTAA